MNTLKSLFDKIFAEIKDIADEIENYATQNYVGFKYRGRQIAGLGPHRKSFDVWAQIIDENGRSNDYETNRIETGEEKYSDILERIKTSYEKLKALKEK